VGKWGLAARIFVRIWCQQNRTSKGSDTPCVRVIQGALVLRLCVHYSFLPCDAYAYSVDNAVARCLSVRLSHAGIESKRLYISSVFFTIG